jgi:tetratricopeptide (TPR) repeat protein
VIPTLHIHLLGDFMLVSGETPVTTVTVPRVQSLLAYLVLHRSAPQDRSHLAFLLWPDSTTLTGPLTERRTAAPSNPAWRNEWVELQFAQIWPLRGSTDDMTVVIEKARPVIEQYGTKEQRELLLYAISTRDLIRARYIDPVPEKRISFLRNAVAALEQTGDQNKLGTFHFVFGHALLWSNQLDEAEEQFEKALRVAEHIGRAWLQTRSLTFLPFIYRRRGQVEQVRDLLTRAHAIGADHNNRVLTGHRAWVAWRDGNLLAAETYGREAVEETSHEQQEINALQWVGRWPLIGVALAQEKTAEAMNNVRLLLDPAQQQPVEQVKTLLERALQAWDVGQQEEVCALLQQVVPLAENMGYL